MNFIDKVHEMDYEVKTRNDKCIVIERKEDVSDIVIIFDLTEKVISGYLKPNNIIKELEDITHQYTLFREMKSDLKKLSDLSNYEII